MIEISILTWKITTSKTEQQTFASIVAWTHKEAQKNIENLSELQMKAIKFITLTKQNKLKTEGTQKKIWIITIASSTT